MRVKEIEILFQGEATLEKALDGCKEAFDRVDYHSNNMRIGVTDNPEEVKTALNELTGILMNLKPILAIAETFKKNEETKRYNEIKINTENEGSKKFVSASAEKEASAYVATYRRIRNLIQAYVDSCEKAISTLQSVLKFMTEELKMTGTKHD